MSRLSDAELAEVRRWLARRGIARPEDYRDSFLQRRVQARLDATGEAGVRDLLRAVDASTKGRDAFLQKLLIPTTEFFRNPEVFEAFVAHARERAGAWGRPVRILSAGCSTGEEPVTLAILLAEAGLDFRILAADRSMKALAALRSGSYEARALAKVDKRLRERYFIPSGQGARVAAKVASRVQPLCWDLGKGLPPGPFHGVFLRNVLIYLTEAAKGRLLGQAAGVLAAGGILVLGRTDSAGRAADGGLVPLDREKRIYERSPGGPRSPSEGGCP